MFLFRFKVENPVYGFVEIGWITLFLYPLFKDEKGRIFFMKVVFCDMHAVLKTFVDSFIKVV